MFTLVDKGVLQGERLSFVDSGRPSLGAKTRTFEVRYRTGWLLLGHVRWVAVWRQYAFAPIGQPLEKLNLREIADFCEEATGLRRSRWKNSKVVPSPETESVRV